MRLRTLRALILTLLTGASAVSAQPASNPAGPTGAGHGHVAGPALPQMETVAQLLADSAQQLARADGPSAAAATKAAHQALDQARRVATSLDRPGIDRQAQRFVTLTREADEALAATGDQEGRQTAADALYRVQSHLQTLQSTAQGARAPEAGHRRPAADGPLSPYPAGTPLGTAPGQYQSPYPAGVPNPDRLPALGDTDDADHYPDRLGDR